MNFWQGLRRPFFVLAPMAEVTDVVFREFVARRAKPDVFYTEFVSVKGLLSDEGRGHLLRDLFYTENQRPIAAQLFGSEPEEFERAAAMVRELGFDGVDINMGCPDKKVEKQGAGAALIRDPGRAKAIILAAREGAGNIPVSVKTRIGYNEIITEEWVGELASAGPAAIAVHLRTRKELSKVPAHWKETRKAADAAHAFGIPFVANGDVGNREEGEQLARESGADGIMIGRGVYGNPRVFGSGDGLRFTVNSGEGRGKSSLEDLAELIVMFDGFWEREKNYEILKRFFASYISGFRGAKELRVRLLATKSADEALDILGIRPAYEEVMVSEKFVKAWGYLSM